MHTDIALELRDVSDDELLRRLADLVTRSQVVEVELVAHIGEVDERRLFARRAFPSMFAYCTEALHLSEAEAYRRITVARAARKHPAVLAALRDGRVHLSGLARVVPLLTANNAEALLRRATHLTTRQVERLVSELSPKPDVPVTIRKLPGSLQRTAAVADTGHAPTSAHGADDVVASSLATHAPELVARRVATPRWVVEPLSPARFRFQFTAGAELRDKLDRLQALMRSEVPDGDLATVIERAVTEKLERLEARRYARTASPRTTVAQSDTSKAARYIPAAVRRAVHARDGSQCGFVDDEGRRCSEKWRLEFHHRRPYALGGDHSLGNLGLLCRQHNRLMAEHDYGRAALRGGP